jgi:hypothetical protein
MKKQILLLLVCSLFFSAKSLAQETKTQSNDSTEMIFNETDHNFGTITYQGNGTFEFVFKNTGKAPLIIKHVQSTCGCTTPDWSKDPIAPKEKGKVTVRYDTERVGPFIKTIKVYSNAKNSPIDLVIRGEVKEKTL